MKTNVVSETAKEAFSANYQDESLNKSLCWAVHNAFAKKELHEGEDPSILEDIVLRAADKGQFTIELMDAATKIKQKRDNKE